MSSRGAFQSMYPMIGLKQTCGIKNVTLKAAKKFVCVAVYLIDLGRVIYGKDIGLVVFFLPTLCAFLPANRPSVLYIHFSPFYSLYRILWSCTI